MRPTAYRMPYTRDSNYILPLGCIHWPYTDKAVLRQWRDEMKRLKAHTILCGDVFDFSRTHFRDWVRSYRGDNHSQAWIDDAVKREVNQLAALLAPVSDRIIGVLRGNHYHETLAGLGSDQLLADELKIPYLGDTAFVRLEMRDRDQVRHQMTLHAHHGLRSCSTAGADINDLLKTDAEWDADIHILAHTHRLGHAKRIRRSITSKGTPRVIENEVVFVRTGTLDRGQDYDEALSAKQVHTGSYAERKRYPALPIGYPKIRAILSTVPRLDGEGGQSISQHRFEVTT